MVFRTLRWKCALLAAACVLVLGAASRAGADSIMLEWDPGSVDIGYKVHVGTQSGSYTQNFDVGSATSFTFPTAVAGQRYCFAVSAYLISTQLEGPNSTEVCGYSNAMPTLVNPGNRTSSVGQTVNLQLQGSDPESQPLTYSATGLPPGISLMASTGFISGAGTTAGNYTVTVRAFDGVLTASQTFTWQIAAAIDTTVPLATINAPTAGDTWSTTTATLAVSGASSDNVGVTQVRWSSDRGGSGIATGTTSWSASNIPLLTGTNVITITAVDAAGNAGTDSLAVTYTAADTTRPTVTIGAPTTGTMWSTTSASMTMSGTASDNVGVAQVRWSSDRGGTGVATGTTNWSLAGIPLVAGSNVITVTAVDAAGNAGTDSLTVTYNAVDTTRPTATIGAPTAGTTWSTTSASMTMSGSASDNVGVAQVRWSNDRGGNGVATGTTNWSLSGIPLMAGANVITVTAVDAAGNTGTDALTVTYNTTSGSDVTRPTVAITYPNNPPVYMSPAMSMAGTSSDNVGVTQVRWSSDRGGSGVAVGTGTWFVDSLTLASGTNVITVTAVDAAGNQGSVTMTVTYGTATTPPPPPPPDPTPSPAVTLSVTVRKGSGWRASTLRWSNAAWSSVNVYRNGMLITNTQNDGYYTDPIWSKGTYTYKVCAPGSTTTCSNSVTVRF